MEAVIDKDSSSALLAIHLGVDRLLFVTDVDRVYLDFGEAHALGLDEIHADALRTHAAQGHFPAGSMGPKVEAALCFVEQTRRPATVTTIGQLAAALAGRAGTRVVL